VAGWVGWKLRRISSGSRCLMLLFGLLAVSGGGTVGCGFSHPQAVTIPTGSYTVTVTATASDMASGYSGATTETATFTVTITQ